MLLVSGCNTDPVLSVIPEISFESVTIHKNIAGKDSLIILSINYKDGDGDLGLSVNDTMAPFNLGGEGFFNFLVGYKVLKNNAWQNILIPGSSDTLNFNQRFERLNPTEKKRTVSGIIDLRIPASPYPGLFPDTIKLVSQMMDRAMHKSNVSESTPILLKH